MQKYPICANRQKVSTAPHITSRIGFHFSQKRRVDALIYSKVIVPLWWLCAESTFIPRVGTRSPQGLKGNQVKLLNSPAAVILAKQAS